MPRWACPPRKGSLNAARSANTSTGSHDRPDLSRTSVPRTKKTTDFSCARAAPPIGHQQEAISRGQHPRREGCRAQIVSRRTNQMQEAQVYSPDGPIRCRKRGYIVRDGAEGPLGCRAALAPSRTSDKQRIASTGPVDAGIPQRVLSERHRIRRTLVHVHMFVDGNCFCFGSYKGFLRAGGGT
eukprot:1176981-Prorocentrum_minimum.AAC.1